jgi:sodium-dependent dicarboxylate transporter 2/3/5
VSFGTWFLMGLPLAAAMLVIIWLIITRWMCRIPAHVTVERGVLDREAASLGPMSFEERAVLVVFATTAGLWLFRKDLVLGVATLPGWSRLIPFPDLVDDGTVAMAMALLLFFVPTRSRDAASPTVMAPDVLVRLPWDIVLLFGGGFALAKGFQVSGLSAAMGEQFAGLAGLPPVAMIAMVCAGLTFLTEVTSNTATTQMILPILASVAVQVKTNPLVFMIPATLAASCAFMMPVATPPNAIVFGSGRVRMIDMARVGLVINLVGVVVITVLFITLGVAVFGIDLAVFPDWAVSPVS